MSNNLQEVVRYVRSALDNHCVFVHMTAPQLESLLAGLEELQRENADMKDAIHQALTSLQMEHPMSAESTLEDFVSTLTKEATR